MTANRGPVGVFDSGAGGISVLKTMARLLPNEDFLFYGDDANAPYGTKTPEEVRRLAENAVRFLLENSAKAVVIACNTATAAAAETLRARYQMPIIGMEPAIKPASGYRKGGIVLSMATPGTLKSEKYRRLSEKYGEGVVPLPCPGLMEFVERGILDGGELREYLQRLFAPFQDQKVDAVVLGCTHYVFLRHVIASFFAPGTPVLDGNLGTAKQLERRLAEEGLLAM
ncbi:MAG: glutamate racemase, partial [Clostridia bacterium]|nr:glutamate racemase [Clostridia bacterium]